MLEHLFSKVELCGCVQILLRDVIYERPLTQKNIVIRVELVVAARDATVVDLSVDLNVQVLADPVHFDRVPLAVVDFDLW